MVVKITEKEFEELTKEGKSIVDFSATWCGPCKMLEPVLESVSEEYKDDFKFYSMDVDENMDLAQKFEVEGVPTILVLENGKEINRSVGFIPKNMLKDFLDKNK